MAKTLINSASFTILLIVLVIASTGILNKSEASPDCYNKGAPQCPNLVDRVFYGECGPAPFVGGECECCKCCMQLYGSPPVCWALVEGSDNHCHCYTKKA